MYNIHKSWKPLFDQFNINLDTLYKTDQNIYPTREDIFKVFSMDVKEIKILLLGQDPYHRPTQAHGLSFSVPSNVKAPPSLKNIFKELQLEFPDRNYKFENGNLEQWFTREKIFLLNSSLSVIEGQAGSHMKIWEIFTDKVIKFISENNNNCIYLLLGNFAKSKATFIKQKDKIVEETHPSPLARGFIGSNVFRRVEDINGSSINWQN